MKKTASNHVPTEVESGVLESLVSPAIRALEAYQVHSAEGMIKLDAMENPYELPENLVEEWKTVLTNAEINRYPDPNCTDLRKAVSQTLALSGQQGVVFGNGSDELIQMLVTLTGGEGKTVLAPDPSFSMYRQICIPLNTRFVGVPLESDFRLDQDRILRAVEKEKPSCIFLAYPNNPTGNCFESETIQAILDLAPGLVVIDEAYFAFCQSTWLAEIPKWNNLVLLRTMSKSGLAGLRLGLLIADPIWTQQIEKLRLPYNINSLTQLSAKFFLAHHKVFEEQSRQVVKNRESLFRELSSLHDLQAYPSQANFVLIRVNNADQVFQDLQGKGVLIRNLSTVGTPMENCLRVTVGTEEENQIFLTALKSVLNR